MFRQTSLRRRILFLFLSCSLIASGAAFCGSDAKAALGDKAPPAKPTLTPTGPDLVLKPGTMQRLRATAAGATRFEWSLQGEGKISSANGDTILYTAPDRPGLMAMVTVLAYNGALASPPSSISISTLASSAVGLDAMGIPAGWMAGAPDPTPFLHLSSGAPGCHSGATCIKVKFHAGATWAGILWWPVACGPDGRPAVWQRVKSGVCATDVLAAGNLHSVSRASFWARGDRGGEVVELKVGDSELLPLPGRSTGKLTLSASWKEYGIDLSGLDMRHAVALFMVLATDLHNPKGATFYLDEIQFEGAR
jgi:hypothetical protein